MYTNFDRFTDLLVIAVTMLLEWRFIKTMLPDDGGEPEPPRYTFKERRARRKSERRYRRYLRNRAAYLEGYHYAD